MSELSDVRRERIQKRITKAILADHGQEVVDQIVSVNELDEDDANEMIKTARAIRTDRIRGLYMKKVWLGALVVSLGIGSIYGVLMLTGHLEKPILLLGGFMVVLGLLTILSALIGILRAPSKRGEVKVVD